MDVLDGRSVMSLSDAEIMPVFDSIDAEINRLEGIRLQLIARIEDTGYAQELGARDAIDLVSKRYRRDRAEVWRDVRLARALPRYAATGTALTEGIELPAEPSANGNDDPNGNPTGNTIGNDEADDARAAGDGARLVRPMRTAQAAAIVSELERVRSRVPVEDLDVVEEQFVALAAHLAPGELRSAAREVCDLLDSDGPEPEEHKAAARESLTLTSVDRGVKFKGYLANENAELLRAVVHAGARPHKTVDGEPDPRSRDKRQADALSTALGIAATAWDTNTKPPAAPADAAPADTSPADAAPADTSPANTSPTDAVPVDNSSANTSPADTSPAGAAPAGTSPADTAPADVGAADATAGALGAGMGRTASHAAGRAGRGQSVPGYGAKANITVTIDLEDLKAATAGAVGRTVYGDGLSAATIRRLACDANIIPLVLGSNSEPLDVGRSERLVTRAMRRALNTRDRGCVVCGAPPIMCDAHHLISWLDGGGTTIENLVLLCRRHHTDLHNGRWTITITHGVVQVAHPSWADPPPMRRTRPAPSNPCQPLRTADAPTAAVAVCVAGRPTEADGRASRWRADAATYAEAARFAVWDGITTAEAGIGPPSFATI
ncbi:MAG TPA: DUF222 domain-containing protein [Kribbella sp.]